MKRFIGELTMMIVVEHLCDSIRHHPEDGYSDQYGLKGRQNFMLDRAITFRSVESSPVEKNTRDALAERVRVQVTLSWFSSQ